MRTLDFVGPEGYVHGWKFVGIPGVTPHTDLLRMRTESRAAHPAGHPERLKAENAVRKSRKLGMHTGEEPPVLDSHGRLKGTMPMNRETTKALKADTASRQSAKMATTPGETPAGLRQKVAEHADTSTPKGRQQVRQAVKEAEAAVPTTRLPRSGRKAKGGIHPSEVTTTEPVERTGHSYPTLKEQRRGVVPTTHKEWVTSLRHGDKHLGSVHTDKQHLGSHLSTGNSKDVYLGGGDTQFTALTAHVQAVEKAKGRVAAEVNARRARAALSGSGFGAVKSHSTSVKGWRNYDPGHETSATDKGVRIDHYTGSSLGQSGTRTEDKIHRNLEGYAAKLEEKGFHVERDSENGKTKSLFLPNSKQGAGFAGSAPPSAPPPAPKAEEPVKSRGVRVNVHDEGVKTYLHFAGDQVRAKQRAERILEIQARHAPHVVANTTVNISTPNTTSITKEVRKLRPGAFTAGTHSPGGVVTLHPKLFTLHGKGNEESSNFHVPTLDKVGRLQANFTHEIGHGVHSHLPQGGYTSELWDQIADKIGAPRPELAKTKLADMKKQFEDMKVGGKPEQQARIDKLAEGMTQDSVDHADALINRGTLQKWVEENKAAISHSISDYAATSPNELMAELWTEATLNHDPRAAAKAYAEYAKAKMQEHEYDLYGNMKGSM